MATQLFFVATDATPFFCTNTNLADLAGVARGWWSSNLSASRGNSSQTSTRGSVAGTTLGIEAQFSSASEQWISPPLDQDVTISGTITFNIRAAESSMSANAGAQVVIERLDNTGAVVSTVINSERGTEMGTSEAAQNWTGSPTSTAFNKGDRIRARVAFNDAGGTMASGFTLTFWHSGPTGGASGDSYITFTETFGFAADPAGTVLYPTGTSAGIDPGAGTELEAWTSRGGGVATAVTNVPNGWAAPTPITITAGGTAVTWYSKPLTAFTLSGIVRARCRASGTGSNASMRCQVSVCNTDGSSPVVWGAANLRVASSAGVTTTELSYLADVSGDDVSVTDGQRLLFNLYVDDASIGQSSGANTLTYYYAGAVNATGDSYMTLTQSVTEFAGAVPRYGFTNFQDPGLFMQRLGGSWRRRRSGIVVPDFPRRPVLLPA